MAHPASPERVALIGAGRVGSAIAHLLRASGSDIVSVTSRSSAEGAAVHLGSRAFSLEHLPPADLYLIATPDQAIEPVAQVLAQRVLAPAVVVHVSGVSGTAPLAGVAAAGAHVAALHPVQACPDVETAIRRLPGSAWGVTAAEDVAAWADELIRERLGGVPIRVPEEVRARWHAAAVMTSNGIAALLAFAEELVISAGIDDPMTALAPLAAGTVTNAHEGGGGAATLTGPVVRGEVATVERHLAGLAADPHLADAYRVVGRMILRAAQLGGRIDATAAARIEDALL